MKFETFEAKFIKQNRELRLLLGIVVILLSLNLTLVLSDKKYFVLKNSKLVNTRPLLTWACEESFISITKKSLYKDLVEDSIVNELQKSEFKVSVDEVLSVLEVKDNLCKIIVKGDGKIRSFLVSFNSKNSYPFYYKLSEINEIELSTTELALTKESK